MGKKSAHTGESPKDRSINMIDKFITKSTNQQKHLPVLPGRRKDPNIPIYMWPLKDQLDYWENQTAEERFDLDYRNYAAWYESVKAQSGLYHQTFIDFTSKLKPEMKTMFANKMLPKNAVYELRKKGVY
jgi:hypothetical protein